MPTDEKADSEKPASDKPASDRTVSGTPAEDAEKPQSWFEWLTTTAKGAGTLLTAVAGVITAGIAVWHAIYPDPDPKKDDGKRSSICQFTDGWIDYSPLPGAPVGAECQDGSGGYGQTVAKGSGRRIPISTVCQFGDGWHNYTFMTPGRIGAGCHNGMGKLGQIVATGIGPEQ